MTLGAGIGLRAAHYRDFLAQPQDAGWLEVHSENMFHLGGRDFDVLRRLRRDYPVSLHGVGLGLGSAQGFSMDHVSRVRGLIERIEPVLVSEHLCWHAIAGRHLNDLLPITLDKASFELVARRIDQVQEALGRQILVENVSTYLRYRADAVSEAQFLAALANRTGCGILLDVNNLYVNQCNHGEDAMAAIATLAAQAAGAVGEIHLGGHLRTPAAVVDNHGGAVDDAVWTLYRAALAAFGQVPTLIEWDTDVPPLPLLLAEAHKARALLALAGEPARSASARAAVPAPDWPPSTVAPDHSQAGFAAALLDGGADLITKVPAKVGAGAGPDISQFAGGDAVPARLALYRGQLMATWRNSLASAYPVLEQLVGAHFFEGLSRDFGLAHPPRDADLHRFGAGLAEFLAGFDAVAEYPWLPDMARLEWALHCAYYAPGLLDAPALDAATLSSSSASGFAAMRCGLRPGVALVASPWALSALWRAHQGAPWPERLDVAESLVVSRQEWRAHITALTPADDAALRSIGAGGSMGDALAAALQVDSAFDLGAALQRWLALQLLGAGQGDQAAPCKTAPAGAAG